MKYFRLAALIIIVISLATFMSSCKKTIEDSFTQDVINDLYERAEKSVIRYGEEPSSGEIAPFPSSLSIAGKAVWINVPVDYGFEPTIPAEQYKNLGLSEYSWYTDNPDDVLYVILIDRYYSPSDEYGNGNTIIFTITDLAYEEKIYRSFLTGESGLPYRELADILENLALK